MAVPRKMTRSNLHHVYYWLAGFDLVTVTTSLIIIWFVSKEFAATVASNRDWTERLEFYSNVGERAAAVARPANNAFDEAHDRLTQREAFVRAGDKFELWLEALEEDSTVLDRAGGAAPLASQARGLLGAMEDQRTRQREIDAGFGDIVSQMKPQHEGLTAKARLIFESLAEADGEPSSVEKVRLERQAGQYMAQMDEHFYAYNEKLDLMRRGVGQIQRKELEEQGAIVGKLPMIEMIMAGVILVMVSYWTIYGRRLAHEMKETSLDLEEQVRARTAELETTHQRLRLADRLASIGTLAAGLGHDMNNVLFPVRCRLDALDAANLEPAPKAEVKEMRSSVEYLQQLSDGLRLLALDPDAEEGESGADATTDLAEWWDDVRPLFLTALPSYATLVGGIPAGSIVIDVAPHRLTQAIFNLVVNAGEAIDEAGTVRVEASASAEAGFVDITVTDTGQGMPEDVRRQALDPFFTTKKRELSTGLGLALVHGVARGAGGHVDIVSTPSKGTAVTLTVPAAADAAASAIVEGSASRSASRSATITMGDRRVAALVAAMLKGSGFEVDLETPVPDSGTIWVTDASTEPERGQQFLAGDATRRIVVVGDASTEWRRLGAIPVPPPGEFEAIRAALGAAISDSTEHAS